VPGISYRIYWVRPLKVFEYWQLGYKYIQEAMVDPEYSTYTMADLLNKLLMEEMQLWIVSKNGAIIGIIVTEVYPVAAAKVCNILLVSGEEFENWRGPAIEMLKHFAKILKCDKLLANNGRPGWKKWASVSGFKVKSIAYECSLGE